MPQFKQLLQLHPQGGKKIVQMCNFVYTIIKKTVYVLKMHNELFDDAQNIPHFDVNVSLSKLLVSDLNDPHAPIPDFSPTEAQSGVSDQAVEEKTQQQPQPLYDGFEQDLQRANQLSDELDRNLNTLESSCTPSCRVINPQNTAQSKIVNASSWKTATNLFNNAFKGFESRNNNNSNQKPNVNINSNSNCNVNCISNSSYNSNSKSSSNSRSSANANICDAVNSDNESNIDINDDDDEFWAKFMYRAANGAPQSSHTLSLQRDLNLSSQCLERQGNDN